MLLALLAIVTAVPLAAVAAPRNNEPPTVSIKAPLGGALLSGTVSGAACEAIATDDRGVRRVEFRLDGTLLNTDTGAPWNCTLDTRRFANGAHTLQAVAFDQNGASASAQVTVDISNTNQPPAVAIQSPVAGATLSGFVAVCSATATDSDGIKQLQWFLDTTLLNTELFAPFDTCDIDTRLFANGIHTLKAVATDNLGLAGSAQVSVNIQNTVAGSASAVATFESLGLYWTPPSNPGAAGCSVRFRKEGDLTWRDGLALWYDARNNECRGSLVHLTPDTAYEIEIGGQAQLTARTWSENFPIAQTIYVSDSNAPLNITQGGTAQGYVLYTPAPGTTATIDVANAHDHNITISAPYVIVRGLALKGARVDAIHLSEGARDLVIEDNDISEWGRWSGNLSSDGWKIGTNKDAGVKAYCSTGPWLERTVIQRNRIHHPRYGANSWSDGHPMGPNAVYFLDCGGNHVFRHNEIYSDWSRYFMDAYGGAENFSTKGMPNADSDIYGNRIQHVWDDGIEAEGANRNVRIWGNYFDRVGAAIASTSTSVGPLYIFRNVSNRQRTYSMSSLDADNRMYMMKSGSASGFGDGRRYVFHNTMLQADPLAGSLYPQGGGEGLSAPGSSQPLTNTVSRNNVWHIWKSWWNSVATQGGSGNDLDFDLFNGNIAAYAGAEANGILGVPVYAPGHGWVNEAGGFYQLDPSSLGYERGVRVPNFNDDFLGAAPDMGAHETGSPAMRFGVR